jgi:hypothetical protein
VSVDNAILILEQVNTLKYLECKISYKEEENITSKIGKIFRKLGILKNVMKPNLVQSQCRLKLYRPTVIF